MKLKNLLIYEAMSRLQTSYTDDSLIFCLSDGTRLVSVADEQETLIKPFGNEKIHFNLKNNAPVFSAESQANNQPPQSNSKTGFIITALFALLLLLVVGATAVYFFVSPRNEKISNIQNASTPTVSPTSNSESDELKKKVADLEKQIQDQKKSPTPNISSSPIPVNSPSTDHSGYATARVVQTNDGYLALRTDPSTATGKQILKIPSGATVELENCQRDFIVVDSHRGRWCEVSYNNQIGWVF